MKLKLIILGILLSLISCEREESNNLNQQILGKWELTSTRQLKNETWTNVQISNSKFEFNKSEIIVNGNTFLDNSGKYPYTISKKNYFDNNISEPKSDLLEFNNKRYVIEFGTNNSKQVLTLMNYSDGKIYFRLER